jgi:parallel beta-helix repeat protein
MRPGSPQPGGAGPEALRDGLCGVDPTPHLPMRTSPQTRSTGVAGLRRTGARIVAAAALSAGLCAWFLATSASAGASGCDYVASPSGSDSAAGSAYAPFATVQHLVDTLGPGQTGCLRAGSYHGDVTFSHGGAPGAPMTLTSYPGDGHATVVGRVWLKSGSDYVTVSDLNLVGTNPGDLPSPTVDDAHAAFLRNDVTNFHTAICFDLGDDTGTWGTAHDTLIEANRIHHCGQLPAGNHDHGIYVEEAYDTRILSNVIYQNADRGVQLYPDSQGTVIKGNVIDGNGEGVIFSGDFGRASSNNLVENNVITNSSLRNNVESWYPSGNPVGRGNVVADNCIGGGARGTRDGGLDTSGGGFTASHNLIADPQYANRGAGNYGISSGSPCAAVLAGAPVPPPTQSPPSSKGSGHAGSSSAGPRAHRHHRAAHAARLLAHLRLVARISPRERRLLVHGRITSALPSSREVVVLTRIGHHWRVVGYRRLSRRAGFSLSLRLRRAAVHRRIQVRARLVGVAGRKTILARAS